MGGAVVGRPVISGIERLQLGKIQRGNGPLSFGDVIYLPIVKDDENAIGAWAYVQFQCVHTKGDGTPVAIDGMLRPQAPASPMGDRLG